MGDGKVFSEILRAAFQHALAGIPDVLEVMKGRES